MNVIVLKSLLLPRCAPFDDTWNHQSWAVALFLRYMYSGALALFLRYMYNSALALFLRFIVHMR